MGLERHESGRLVKKKKLPAADIKVKAMAKIMRSGVWV